MNVKEYQTVVLAALLHDIGKLIGRGSFKLLDKGQHPEFSSVFVSAHKDIFSPCCDVPLLKELVQRHHETKQYFAPEFLVQNIEDSHTRTLATLVSKADNLSSSEQYQDYKETPLSPVLERISRAESNKLLLKYHATPLGMPESLNNVFPAKFETYEKDELNKHIEQFGQDFRKLFRGNASSTVDTSNFECLLNHILNIIYRYAWCIPSNTQEVVPDVSLYDHLKNTAAIASCLYIYHFNSGTLNEAGIKNSVASRFYLVVGDISGIQSYIYDIASIGAGGVARRLRSRSLYVQLCSEIAAHMILRKLNIPILVNTIMNSGGKFYLLLPDLPNSIEAVQEVQEIADSWFLKELNGELALNLAGVVFGDKGFEAGKGAESGFAAVLEKVNAKLSSRKQNRFARVLSKSDKWEEESFVLDVHYDGKEVCASCRKFPRNTNELCVNCERDRRSGANLPAARYVTYYDSTGGDIPVLGYSASICESVEQIVKSREPYLVTKLNNPDISDLPELPATSKYMAKFVPEPDRCQACQKDTGTIATFECIAKRSEGDNLLGVLRADVDNLGRSFVFGLKGEAVSADTISRLSTFSRMLDIFFTGWVEYISSQGKNFYTVYSGGDDLFIVGPWDEVIIMADRIRQDFTRFTGNELLTMSAGITIVRHDYPVPNAAEDAGQALEQSKDKGRDRITILGQTLTWPEWSAIKDEWLRLSPLLRDLSSAFLYNMLRYADMWNAYKKREDVLGLRYHPLLAYNISRNLDRKKSPEIYDWAQGLLKWPPDEQVSRTLDNLGLLIMLCLYKRRGGKE